LNYSEYKQKRFERLRHQSGLPQRFWDINLSTLVLTDDNREALVAAQAYLTHIKDHARVGKGVILTGPPGRGKTSLGAAILQEAMRRGGESLYMPVRRYQKILGRSMSGDEEAEALVRRAESDLYVLFDDLGKEYATASGYIENYLESLLRDRYDAGRPSIISTNVPKTKWEETYGPSMYSFAHEAFVWIPVLGPDWRRRAEG
jgi:DNA replication protein DnaC